MTRLSNLIHPLSPDEFVRDYWHTRRPYVAHNLENQLQALFEIPEFQSVESLVDTTSQRVKLFGPNQFRSHVSASVALDFYHRGDTLYFTGLEADVVATQDLLKALAEDLGVPADAISIEAFAGRSGATASLHYDWDINFQVLLCGRKTWQLAPNENVVNPRHSFIPPQRWGDEAVAIDRTLPETLPDDASTFETYKGSSLFLPRGMWHQTTTIEDSIGVNFVLRPMMWSQAFGKALTRRMEQDDELRDFCVGGLGHGVLAESAVDRFDRLKAKLCAAAADVQFDDAVWSSVHREWTWRTDGDPRLVRHEDGTQSLVCGSDSDAGSSPVALPRTFVPLVSELLQFQYRFGLHEARFLSRDLRSEDVLSLLVELENAGFLTPAP